MVKNNDNNGVLLKQSIEVLKDKKVKAFIATFIYLSLLLMPLTLFFISKTVGIVLFSLVYGYLTSGYIRFMKMLINSDNANLYVMFEVSKDIFTLILLGLLFSMMSIIGTIFLVIPGLLVVACYSFSFYIAIDEDNTSVFELMRLSSVKSRGKKTDILSYKIVYYLMNIVIITLFILASLLVSIIDIYIVWLLLQIILAIALVAGLSFVTMYLFTSNHLFYENILKKSDYITIKDIEGKNQTSQSASNDLKQKDENVSNKTNQKELKGNTEKKLSDTKKTTKTNNDVSSEEK